MGSCPVAAWRMGLDATRQRIRHQNQRQKTIQYHYYYILLLCITEQMVVCWEPLIFHIISVHQQIRISARSFRVRKKRHSFAWNMGERWREEVVGRKHTETWCLIHQHYTASLGLASICIACIFSNVLHFFWGWHIQLTWTDPTKARSHSRRAADDCLGNGGIREDRRKRRQAAISNPCFRSDCLAH